MKNKGIVIGVFAVVFVLAAVLLFVCLNPPKPAYANIDSTPKKINEIAGFEEILTSPVTAVEIRDLVSAGVKEPLTDEDILQSVNDFLNNSKFSCTGKVESPKSGVYYNGGGGDYVTLTTEKGEFSFNAVSDKEKMWLWIDGYEYEVIGNEGNVFDEAFRLGYERYVK